MSRSMAILYLIQMTISRSTPTVKIALPSVTVVLTVDLHISVVDVPSQISLTLLTFIVSPILQELSIYRRWFLFGMSTDVSFQLFTPKERSVNNNVVSRI